MTHRWNGPDFCVPGAAKAGTTAIWTWLRHHPEVFLPDTKEPGYFAFSDSDPRPKKGFYDPEYTAQITTNRDDYAALYEAAGARKTGDVSPVYLTSAPAITRLAEARPDARIIISLRNPVARAFSQYLHHRRDGLEPLSHFDEALNAENDRIAQGWSWSYAYCGNGHYQTQIRHILKLFPRTQVLFVDYAELQNDAAQCWRRICAHLDLSAIPLTENRAVNTTHDLTHVPTWQGMARTLKHPGAIQKFLKPLVPPPLRRKVRDLLTAGQAPLPSLEADTAARLRQCYSSEFDWLREQTGLALADW